MIVQGQRWKQTSKDLARYIYEVEWMEVRERNGPAPGVHFGATRLQEARAGADQGIP